MKKLALTLIGLGLLSTGCLVSDRIYLAGGYTRQHRDRETAEERAAREAEDKQEQEDEYRRYHYTTKPVPGEAQPAAPSRSSQQAPDDKPENDSTL